MGFFSIFRKKERKNNTNNMNDMRADLEAAKAERKAKKEAMK